MIDHEAEIFHAVKRIETLIGEMRGMQMRAAGLLQIAEGFAPNGVEWKRVYHRGGDLLEEAIALLAEERAELIQLQIDTIEKRKLDGLAHLAIEEDFATDEARMNTD